MFRAIFLILAASMLAVTVKYYESNKTVNAMSESDTSVVGVYIESETDKYHRLKTEAVFNDNGFSIDELLTSKDCLMIQKILSEKTGRIEMSECFNDINQYVILSEFIKIVFPYLESLEVINDVEFITDVFHDDDMFEEISLLYKTGVFTGNEYGAFCGDKLVTVGDARKIIGALLDRNKRTLYNPKPLHGSAFISVDNIRQNPELPTGCEVTSLATVINYLGFEADKLILANEYLDFGEIGVTNPSVAFVGDPENRQSYGCFAPVIKKCADKFFEDNKIDKKAYDITGCSADRLFLELEQGNPVIVWATMFMMNTNWIRCWNIDGEDVYFPVNEHCMVLTGYNIEKNVVYVADPLKGNTTYKLDLFLKRFDSLKKQAVIIK